MYLVDVNQYRSDGIKGALPEIQGIATHGTATIDDTVEWASWAVDGQVEPVEIRDVTVELLSTCDDCWSCLGPETMN